MRSSVAAVDMSSQYVIFPVAGMTTRSPGSEEAEFETKAPKGSGSEEFLAGCGNVNMYVLEGSGDEVIDM